MEQLNGQSCRFADKAKTNRYSPKLLQLAASLYTRGKSVYKDASEFMVLPSISTMEKTKQAHSSSSGDCSNLYLNFRRRFKCHSVMGILAGDEMKLEEGIAWSTSTHKISGFVNDQLNFDEIMDLFSDSAPHVEKEVCVLLILYLCMVVIIL